MGEKINIRNFKLICLLTNRCVTGIIFAVKSMVLK